MSRWSIQIMTKAGDTVIPEGRVVARASLTTATTTVTTARADAIIIITKLFDSPSFLLILTPRRYCSNNGYEDRVG